MDKFKKILSFKGSRLLLVTLLVLVGAGYVYRDLHLGMRKVAKIPDIVVKNIKLDRDVNGKRWKFLSPRVEHKNETIYADKLDVTVTETNGSVSRIFAEKGVFSRKSNDLQLTGVKGKMRSKDREYAIETGFADYDPDRDIWKFANDIAVFDDRAAVSGETAIFDAKNGDCTVEGRGKVEWFEK